MKNKLLLFFAVTLWIVGLLNGSYFEHLFALYDCKRDCLFLLSTLVVLVLVFMLVFVLLALSKITKVFLILFLLLASVIDYFMQSYHILIDRTMIQNIFATDSSEAGDLFSPWLLAHIVLYGVMPSVGVWFARVETSSLLQELKQRLKAAIAIVALIGLLVAPLSAYYTSFMREHKIVRFYINPLHAIFAMGRFLKRDYFYKAPEFRLLDTNPQKSNHTKRRVVIFVAGEATRADHANFNGYNRTTYPLLSKEPELINFAHVSSCGTTTAISIPCMFSYYGRDNYETKKALYTQNLLDILKLSGIKVVWYDNNSDPKGLAKRVGWRSYKSKSTNKICEDGECRDEGMLVGLKSLIEQTDGDIFVVLHQMGNHGPAYYKRYPKRFEHFKPVCKTNQLQSCSKEEIVNAYDNALRYSDYFLSKTLALLKSLPDATMSAMIYVADHGESLGENGLYLHGVPYFVAPDAQRHVPMFAWFGKGFEIDKEALRVKAKMEHYSHDNLFSTLLGIYGIKSKAYNANMDIFRPFMPDTKVR